MDQELICRACFTKTARCLSIFSELVLWNKVISLYTMIMACAPVEISVTDGLPSKICENCLTKLQYSFLFRMQILQADIKLRNYARKTRVFHLNSAIGDFLPEPILKDSKSNIQEIYSLDQILQSSPLLNANTSDNDESFNKSCIKNELKTEPVKNEITELIEEVIVISDENETDKQICSMESNEVHDCNESSHSNSPLHDETSVDPDILPTIVTFNIIQIEPTPQIYSDDLTGTCNKIETGVAYNKHSISSVIDSINDCNEINTNKTLLDQTVSNCNLQSKTIRDNTNTMLSLLINKSDPNRGKNVLTLETIKNVADDNSQLNETSDKLQKTSMDSTDERLWYGQNISTCSKQNTPPLINSTTKGMSLVIKHTVNEKTNNLEAFEIPNINLDLINANNTKMKNITKENDDRSKTISNNAKSLKMGMDSILHERNNIEMNESFKNQTIQTRTKMDTNKTESNTPSHVQTVTYSAHTNPTNSKILPNVPANNKTVVAENRTKNKQKPDKNSVVSKDECTNGQKSHLSQKIILTDQITPVTSDVRGKACEISSDHKRNCALSRKIRKKFMALMTVDDFITIGTTKTGEHSKVKLYKIPTNTSLYESTVANCSKQDNDVSVSNNSRNVKYQITSTQEHHDSLFNKRITRSHSTSYTLSQSCVRLSTQKNATNLTAIHIKNRKHTNSTINKTIDSHHLKRKVNHKVYVNKNKKICSTGQ